MENNIIYKVKTYDFLDEMMKENDYSYDVYFRMAVIDEYLKNINNEKIWQLYDKMQLTRFKQVSEVPQYMVDHKLEFTELIRGFKKDGFIHSNPLLVNNQKLVIDGAHRMACCLFFEIPDLSIYTNEKYSDLIPKDYSKEWFIKNGLYECIKYSEIQKQNVRRKVKCIRGKEY